MASTESMVADPASAGSSSREDGTFRALTGGPAQPLSPDDFASSYLRIALDACPDALYVVDALELRFLYVNRMACKFRGVSVAEYLGQLPWEAMGITREKLVQDHAALIAAEGKQQRFEFLGLSVDGERGWMEISRQAVQLHGRWLVIAVMRNISKRKLAQQAAERHKRMYAALCDTNEAIMQATSATELYQMVCDAAVNSGGLVHAAALLPDTATGLMRVEAVAGAGQSRMRRARIPVDGGDQEGQGLVGLAYSSGITQVSNDYLKDERTQHWHASAESAGTKSGAAVPLRRNETTYGVLLFFSTERRAFDEDVVLLAERMAKNVSFALENLARDAERVRAQAALAQSEARFRALTHLSSDWFWEQDAELRFTRFESRDAEKGDFASTLVGHQPWGLSFAMEPGFEGPSYRALMEQPQAYRDLVQVHTAADGKRRYYHTSGEPLFDADGRLIGYRGVSRDITSQRRADERIRYLATHDGLTGLPNRVMFSQLLITEIELSTRNDRQFGLLYVDLDGFKRINDTLGHDAGDVLLKTMAKRFMGTLRGSDTVSRLAGDEFAVLVRDVHTPADLWSVASKILATAIEPLEIMGQTCEVSASIGMAVFPAHGRDELSLMKRADMAMYLAKRAGKNRARISGD